MHVHDAMRGCVGVCSQLQSLGWGSVSSVSSAYSKKFRWSWTALPLSATTPWVNKGTVDHGLLTKPGWPCTLHTLFLGWWNSALHFPCNTSITRWLSQLVDDTGYTPHARSKINSFLGFDFTMKQTNNETINSQCSAKPISSVHYNTNPICLCQDSHTGICFPLLMTFSCLPLPLGLSSLAGAMGWGRLHSGHC